MSRQASKQVSSTPHLDAWMQRLLNQRAELEKWCRQNKLPLEKPKPLVKNRPETVWNRPYQFTLPRWLKSRRERGKRAAIGQTVTERLDDLLEVLWADPNLWQPVAEGESASAVQYYIAKKYGLRFPQISTDLWREIARFQQSRATFFQFAREKGEIRLDPGGDFEVVFLGLQNRLPEDALGALLWDYLLEPNLDHRHIIASLQLSIIELETLRLAAQRFAKELEWCECNRGVVPPPMAATPKHRRMEVDRARAVEKMVKQLLKNPALTNYDLAGSSSRDPKDAELKMAADARRLVELREGKTVVNYTEQRDGRTIGRKPHRSAKRRPQPRSSLRK